MTNTQLLEEARIAYNAEKANYRSRTPDTPTVAEGACCYEQALISEVNPEELADYIEEIEGYRPNPSLVHEI